MTQPAFQPNALDCIVENIFGFLLPFFLLGAGGDANLARDAIQQLALSYNAATATEVELVGRILGFGTVAMDNLRLSMKPDMSDTKILRYRSNAVALSRAGEQCRKILEVMQANRIPPERPVHIPRPAIAAAPPPAKSPQPQIQPSQIRPSQIQPSQIQPSQTQQPQAPQTAPHPSKHHPHQRNATSHAAEIPTDLEAMRRDARMMLAAFSNNGGPPPRTTAAFPRADDPDARAAAAVMEAIAAIKRPATL
jgi:hypothetical protein